MSTKSILQGKLLLQDDPTVLPMPEWAKYYVNLGADIWRTATFEQQARVVVAVSLPSRSYAACLACAGAVLEEHDYQDGKYSSSFQNLLNLPKDQKIKVRFKRSGKDFWEEGIAAGSKEFDGKPAFVIQLTKGTRSSASELISAEAFDSMEFEVSVKSKRKQPELMGSAPRVWAALMEEHSVLDFQTRPTNSITLLGANQSILEEESRHLQIGLEEAGGQFIAAKEIIRPQVNYPESHRCSVFNPRNCPVNNNVTLAIFDGAEAFLALRNYFRQSAWLVLLDRSGSESAGENATQALSSLYQTRNGDAVEGIGAEYRVPGVEALCFVR